MSQETWLITGGAGYIGAHIADLFLENNKEIVIYDSLNSGLESRVTYLSKKHKRQIPLHVADIRDAEKMNEVLDIVKPHGVIHTAGLKAVGESLEKPDEYFEVNFSATAKLIDLLMFHGIKNLVFSSTAAVYGTPDHSNPIKEDYPKNPISPYGASKLAAEESLEKYFANSENHGTALRFFNVVGTASSELMDNSIENLLPIVINKLKSGQAPIIFGTDYPTPDGTCIRDYVDVRDVAAAHLASAEYGGVLPRAMNIGTGVGESVRKVIELVASHFGVEGLDVIPAKRRYGDPGFLCADVALTYQTLNFRTKYNLEDSVGSMFQ